MKSVRIEYVPLVLLLIALGAAAVLSPVSGSPAACVEPPPDLVSWWPAEGSGEDVAGGNDGTVQGASFASGTVGQAFSFDGSDDYVDVADAADLDGQSQLTVEAWIRPASLGWPNPDPDSDYEAAIVSKYDSGTSGQRSYLFGLRDGNLRLSVYGAGDILHAYSDSQVTIDSWSHVAGVWDGSTITLYVDGTAVASTGSGSSPSQTHNSDTALNVGRIEAFSGTYSGPAAFFDGLIDEASLYNRALSAAEIADIAGAGSDGKCREPATATATASSTPSPTPSVSPTATASPTPTLPRSHLPVVMKPLPTPTPTATPTATPAPVIANGGFEQGRTGWAEYSEQGYVIILHESDLPVQAHTGSWATWFGGAYDEAAIIEQTITIPKGQDVLNYWLWIASEDLCDPDYDIAGVLVDDDAVDAYYLCSANNTNGWINRSVDLSDYAGQRVTLTFAAFTDAVLNSNLFIDDVSMQTTLQVSAREPEVDVAAEGMRRPEAGADPGQIPGPRPQYRRLLQQLLASD